MASITELFQSILNALNVDSTIWVQLGIFTLTYFFLHFVVFRPYFRAFLEREKQTTGSTEEADKTIAQTRELEALYQRKARSLNAEIKDVFDKAREDAIKEQEKIQQSTREHVKEITEGAREKIMVQVNQAKEDISKEAPGLGKTIADRLLVSEAR